MNRLESSDGLQFNDNGVFDEQTHTISAVQPHAAVDERHRFLSFKEKTTLQ